MKDHETLEDRRSPAPLSRQEMEDKLSMDQMISLNRLESFGWTLRFIRQPLFQDPVPVVIQGKGKAIGILEEDGKLNINVDIQVRDEP
ncbi:MAG: hypothetical protein L0Y38_02070 [Methylococcaceae bacterium]|nr:hypothetical protein [Methylococcaceae bacterium]MCI0667277.1 hypothetical protein [Methylococcaceae bacterium]MCI0732591.1 hypothetical protein [Methylococcaceae bacterium]